MALHPVDIREVWDAQCVHEQLCSICQDHAPGWRPEDVYAACVNGEAGIYMGDESKGFVVLKKVYDKWRRFPVLFVWVAYGKGFVHDKHLSDIEAIAKGMGISVIRMSSRRKGFERRGWKPVNINYERRIEV